MNSNISPEQKEVAAGLLSAGGLGASLVMEALAQCGTASCQQPQEVSSQEPWEFDDFIQESVG